MTILNNISVVADLIANQFNHAKSFFSIYSKEGASLILGGISLSVAVTSLKVIGSILSCLFFVGATALLMHKLYTAYAANNHAGKATDNKKQDVSSEKRVAHAGSTNTIYDLYADLGQIQKDCRHTTKNTEGNQRLYDLYAAFENKNRVERDLQKSPNNQGQDIIENNPYILFSLYANRNLGPAPQRLR